MKYDDILKFIVRWLTVSFGIYCFITASSLFETTHDLYLFYMKWSVGVICIIAYGIMLHLKKD
jgi:hypothetical protein